ncbi:RNA polymerase sigma factor [Winogradskyella sp. UBA3174]|uniref:RNA polymerase sigma factor n=1 Tax=Winogradskyella sp. UBA3174 TaxID=1947785 RepID=UPI0025DC76F2|nr:RNA polymerase sigma factor [Winogradskyella sp. UBA3174]|tara:strand:+ start:78209 stop:78763 length:555 start_codon:yes stop_codon:yes gene_type:complete
MELNNKDTDEDLVKRLQHGDKTALVELVKKWHKLFCDKSYWLVKDKDVAKDIAQESWLVIINKIDRLKNPKQFKYWSYRIVCNKSTDWLRLQSKQQQINIRTTIDIEDQTKDYNENKNLKQKLLKSINALPTHQNIIVKLFYIESYSLKQISDLLNISVGTAKSRLFYAREKLKTILKKYKYEN